MGKINNSINYERLITKIKNEYISSTLSNETIEDILTYYIFNLNIISNYTSDIQAILAIIHQYGFTSLLITSYVNILENYLILNLLTENKEIPKIECCNETKIDNDIIIKNLPEDKEPFTTIPEIAKKGYYFRIQNSREKNQAIDTYFYNEDGTFTYIDSQELDQPRLDEMFVNLLGKTIADESKELYEDELN